jgi:Protein of unknown function (DUF3987)
MARDAWDCRETIGTLTKHNRIKATKAFISIIGHITADELRNLLDQTEMLNGFANRFLLACVRRSKLLPHGGAPSAKLVDSLGAKTKKAIEAARTIEQITMTPEAACFWEQIYPVVSQDEPGLLGAITARAEAQTIRLALIFALLDGSSHVDRVHLDAALAVWKFCDSSARFIFGDAIGESLADEILRVLRQAGSNGMSRSELYRLFTLAKPGAKVAAALIRLLGAGKVRRQQHNSPHRPPIEMWFAV